MPQSYKLAAIMFTDVVGYVALMEADEQQALALLHRNRKLHKSIIQKYGGKWLKEMGDGILASFSSSSDAVFCAAEIMREAVAQNIDLRIGIHDGEVLFQSGDVFGAGVNIASRIEQMAEPGQVLISQDVHRNVDNKVGIETTFVFERALKHVAKPQKVYAVNIDDIHFQPTPSATHWRRLIRKPVIGVVLSAVVLFGIFAIWQIRDPQSSDASLSEQISDKKVAVMVFENQTENSEMESFGLIISDWITSGLQRNGDAEVISAANSLQVREVSTGELDMSALAEATGTEITIQGRYYSPSNSDQLIVIANVVDLNTGVVLRTIRQTHGLEDDRMDVVDELTQKLLGYWILGEQPRFDQKPPKYDAYQEYIKWSKHWGISGDSMSLVVLQNAYTLDSTFHEAALKMIVAHVNNGNFHSADSIIKDMRRRDLELSPWELLRLSTLR